MELRPTLLSRSAIINVNTNYGRDEMSAYLLVRQIACQFKHPIILDYKSQLTNIRIALKLTDKRFRTLMSLAERLGFIHKEGCHIRLLSKSQDKTNFKLVKRNDYHRTSSPETFKNLTLLHHYHKKQEYAIRKKSGQHYLMLDNSDRPNFSVSLSCRAVSKLLHLNSTSKAKKLIDSLNDKKLITVEKNTKEISKQEFNRLLSIGDRTIRYDKASKVWYKIQASTFNLNYNFKRVVLSKFERLPEHVKLMYLEMGYSIEQIELSIA